MLKISASLTLILMIVFISSGGQSDPCKLKKEDLPALRTFRLGMTKKEIIRLYPRLGDKELPWHTVDANGFTEFAFGQPSADEYLPEAVKRGLSDLRIALLDDRLVKISITYDGFTEWGNVSVFLAAIASALKLPDESHWSKVPSEVFQIRRLTCSEFVIDVQLRPKESRYSLDMSSLIITQAGLDAELESREKSKKERQRKAFKP
jgi:hypothetical protein